MGAGSFGANDVVRSFDSFLTANVPTYFRIVPTAGLNVDAFLVRSNSAISTSTVVSRGSAVRTSASGGAGGAESFSYTDTANQWDGLVVANAGGTGSYYVFRDTTAPSGSVTIGAGNPATTTTRNVTLQLPASDAQTGLYQMRIAVDGVIDTESWEPYAATKAVTLPAGNGTKTVAVQFRNNALMTSPIVTDTITLAPK